jgi:hypothetical protein
VLIRASQNLEEVDWNLLTCTSLLIGAKCHELDNNLPTLDEIIAVMETSPILKPLMEDYPQLENESVMVEEERILNILSWDLNPIIPIDFVETLISIGTVFERDLFEKNLTGSTKLSQVDENK